MTLRLLIARNIHVLTGFNWLEPICSKILQSVSIVHLLLNSLAIANVSNFVEEKRIQKEIVKSIRPNSLSSNFNYLIQREIHCKKNYRENKYIYIYIYIYIIYIYIYSIYIREQSLSLIIYLKPQGILSLYKQS